MTNTDIKNAMFKMSNDATYLELSHQCDQINVFNVLQVERNEKRHSAFLCWLLDPSSEHGLGTLPIKKLLALFAFCSKTVPEFETLFLSGNYDVAVVECTTEKTLGSITGSTSKDRADIWILLSIKDPDGNRFVVPVIIENKVYACEGNQQTNKYHEALTAFCCNEGISTSVEIYLTPFEESSCASPEFLHLTYQQLLDSVIEPLASLRMPENARSLIENYIHTLGTPSNGSEEEVKDPNKLENLIMAISKQKRDMLQKLYHDYKDLFDAALSVAGGAKAEKLLGRLVESSEDACLLQNFWDSNISLFNTILYECRDQIASDTMQQKLLMDIFKSSHRDTSKYQVLWDVDADGTNWQPVKGFERPLPKGKAVAVFFQMWMDLNAPKSIEDVRQVFPTTLNSYYTRSTGAFDSLIWLSQDEVTAITESGFSVKIEEAKWDLYPIMHNSKHDTDFGLGYGPVYEGYNIQGKAMIAKMWRKDDFDNFLEYITKHQDTYFTRVKIVPLD